MRILRVVNFIDRIIMKKLAIVLFCVGLVGNSLCAQGVSEAPALGVKTYMTAKMEECKKKQAVFFQKIADDQDDGWLAMVYFVQGELKMRGHFVDNELSVQHGEFSYFYQNGQLESKGRYENGAKIGVWERWNPNGSPKAERFYSGYKFGDEPILDPDEMPYFAGGHESLAKYLAENLQYPEAAMVSEMQGEVHLSFVINKVGDVERVMVMNSLDVSLDKEAIRLVQNMPTWKPGQKNGKLVNTQLAMPIVFKLKEQ